MDKAFEQTYHALEEDHWWFVSRRAKILDLVRRMPLERDAKMLEVGCSGGPLLELLRSEGFANVYGIDISEDAIKRCRKRGIENAAVMNGENVAFADGTFDLVIASDILEHIENEAQALSEWFRILKPRGTLLIFVPAFNFLWSSHDKKSHHFRRYSKTQLVRCLDTPGFHVERASYWNSALFIPISVVRLGQRLFRRDREDHADQLYEMHPLVNTSLIWLLAMENWVLNFVNLPLGVSAWAACRK